MTEFEVNGSRVRLTKYKLIIYDTKDEITDQDAISIFQYLFDEGFIKKDNFPVEIVKIDEK